MSSSLPKNILKLTVALLKHQAELWLGEEAVGIAGETLVEIGGEELQERIDNLIAGEEGAKELLTAAQRADAYFQKHCQDPALKGALSLYYGDLPSMQNAMGKLPKAMDTSVVRDELAKALQQDFPKLTHAQVEEGAELYTEALQRALLPLKNFTLPIIGQVVLDNQGKLKELGSDHDDIKATLERIEKQISGQIRPPKEIETPPGALPPGSYLPFPRNALFTGREADLDKLATALITAKGAKTAKEKEKNLRELRALRGSKKVVITQAITGMGGIGKTQLAVEFAYQYGHHFKGVHWLDLRDPSQLETEIAKNGTKMLLPNWPDELPAQMAYTLNTWKSDGPHLIILDNFEEVGQANDVLAGFQHPNLRMLLTSRRGDWPSNLGLKSVGLKIFTPAESLKFLRELLEKREDDQGDLENLAEHLGHLPLALELAGRYLDKHPRLPIPDYLAQLEHVLEHRSMDNWKPDLKSATNHDLSLIQTFALSWEQVEDEMTQKAFIMAGFLAPNTAIPPEIFEISLGCSQELCDEVLEELFGLGLLRVLDDNAPAIHPLLAEFARRLDAENVNLITLSEKLADIANGLNHEVDRTANYALYTPILPHVRAAAEKGEIAKVEKAGELWNSYGYYIKDMADYAGAVAAYERALKIGEAAFGPDHPQVATFINNLGLVLKDLGDLKGAQAAYQRAIKIGEAAFGPDHPQVATFVNNLGSVLNELGDLKGAQAAYERALKIGEAAFGPDHPNVATRVHNMGMLFDEMGDQENAIKYEKRALEILLKFLPPEHPYIQITKDHLRALGEIVD